jgi:predicted ATPase/DNA-binding winged helix-turn-helix (wHTH) protein
MMDTGSSPDVVVFERFHFDRRAGTLSQETTNGRLVAVSVGSRALAILGILVERAGDLVSRDEIMLAVWPETAVEEANLTVQMTALRRVLDAGRQGTSCILNVPGRGYRFLLQVTRPADAPLAEPASAYPNNLPQLVNALIGRERDATEIEALLSEYHLVTLVGTAGVGKTSLSLKVGADLLARFPDGAWFVELAPLDRAELVGEAVAAVFGLPVHGERSPSDAVAAYLRSRRVLLILDNCEHVIAAVAKLADALLKACPGVFLFATSREALSVAGEHAYPVPLLDVPPRSTNLTAVQAMEHSSVRLFVERAASALGRFSLTDETAPIVAEICHRLDGIPLAIELAAPRLKLLRPKELLARLDDQLRLLTAGNRMAVPRQQTLRAAIEWSYALLAEAEQAMLRRLGVFAGSFTLEATAKVATGAPVEESDVFDVIAGLVNKSLVVPLTGEGENRYRLLEATRAFALEKLADGHRTALTRRLCEHMMTVFEGAYRTWTTTPRTDWLAAYEPDLDNLRVALRWSLGPDGEPTLGVTLVGYADLLWRALSLVQEQRRWFELALAFVDDATPPSVEARIRLGLAWDLYGGAREPLSHVLRAIELLRQVGGEPVLLGQALIRAGNAALGYGNVQEAEQYYDEALSVLRPYGRTKLLVEVLVNAGQARNIAGDTKAARALTEEALTLSKALSDVAQQAGCEGQLAKIIASDGGQMDEAIDHARRAVEASRGHGTLAAEFMALHRLGALLILDEQIEPGRAAALKAFELSRALGNAGLPGSIYELALVLAVRGESVTAARLVGFADRYAEQHQLGGFEIATWMRSRLVERLLGAMRPDECQRAIVAGAAWSEQEAVAAAEAA